MFLYVLMVVLTTSCAFHSGIINNSASLGSKNFKIVKLIKGYAKTKKYFGLGGLNKNALVFEAKKDMYENNPLNENQTIANVTVDFKNTIILIYTETKVTITAEVVEFTK